MKLNLSTTAYAAGEDRTRFDCAQAFLSYIGIAPVKEESGKKRWVHWRWSCPIFLRQTFKAIRALAYKWGRVLLVMLAG